MPQVQELQGTIVNMHLGLLKGIVFPGEDNPVMFAHLALTRKDIVDLEATGHSGLRVVLKGNGFYAVGRVEQEKPGDWFLFYPESNHLVVDPNVVRTGLPGADEIFLIRNGARFEFKLHEESMIAGIALNGNNSEPLKHAEFVLYEIYTVRERAKELFLAIAGSVLPRTSPVVSQGENDLAK